MAAKAKQRSTEGVEPFLKWAGGKRQLLSTLIKHLPRDHDAGVYHEPFLGSGALFFALSPKRAQLADTNPDLVLCYRVVQQDLESLAQRLSELAEQHRAKPKEVYYGTRAAFNRRDNSDDAHRAAQLIYLNRTCFNGLYRVNRRGEFNVPMGSYQNPAILQYDRLQAANAVLQNAELRCACFTDSLKDIAPQDFAYLDPPYIPVSATANFTAYTNQAFGLEQQGQLADTIGTLAQTGTRLMVSNAEHPHIRELYSEHHIVSLRARRSINSRSDRRGKVGEVLVLAGDGFPVRKRRPKIAKKSVSA